MTLTFARLDPNATAPMRKHPTDAGVDVFANEKIVIPPFSYRVIHTGLTFDVPQDTFLQIWPKGRNNHLLGSGIVDAGYQGEIVVKVVNYSWKPLHIRRGDAIAQLVHLPIICDAVKEVGIDQVHAVQSKRGGEGGIHSK